MIPGRAGGILLHPTSLPGPYGIGDLGPASHRWVEWLVSAGCRLWQVLPLGPTGYGDSPYQSFSAFAGNPLLISPEVLLAEGLLLPEEIANPPAFPSEQIDFGPLIAWKDGWLSRVGERFQARASAEQRDTYWEFCASQRDWLEDFALFMALKRSQAGAPWTTWPEEVRRREADALRAAAKALEPEAEVERVRQFLFFQQWQRLVEIAHAAGLTLVGDIPIFVAHDSADVWSHPEFFTLDDAGEPAYVAGVPPDYFSPTGQRWGNPLYRWDVMRGDGYDWWLRRLRAVLSMVDVVRLDHFRGFEAYWEIPASSPTAETGRWVAGPGADFFHTVRQHLGRLPLIAEDLGVITSGVKQLRLDFDLPGMKVLQFAFDGHPENDFLPHNYPVHCVAYTGTHDNDTALGWYASAPEEERDFCRRYLGRDGSDLAWDLIRAAWASVAEWAIAPLQDVLGLGTEARMNYPSREHGNWGWRARAEQLSSEVARRLAEFNHLYGREAPKAGAEVQP